MKIKESYHNGKPVIIIEGRLKPVSFEDAMKGLALAALRSQLLAYKESLLEIELLVEDELMEERGAGVFA